MADELIVKDRTTLQADQVETQIDGNWLPYLMDMQLSRNYLNAVQDPAGWKLSNAGPNAPFGWLQIERLPVNPDEAQELLYAWQSVLSACHTLNMRVAYVLRRVNGRTRLYLGALSPDGNKATACGALRQCVSIHMPGAVLNQQRAGFSMAEALEDVGTCSGVITGLPSLHMEDGRSVTQTLDKLARGITDGGRQMNYALVVIADPAKDAEISDFQRKLLAIKGELHTLASYSETVGRGESTSSGKNKSSKPGLGMLLGLVRAATFMTAELCNPVGYLAMMTLSSLIGGAVGDHAEHRDESNSLTRSLSREHRDFTIHYCENLIDKHVARMEGGRSTGFWQTGIYVLGEERETVDAVLAVLRSIYSGDESYGAPIRALNTTGNDAIQEAIRSMRFVPLPINEGAGEDGHWHVLGRMYESLTTPLTTRELSIATNLPQSDVPGLRLVRNSVHFSANPAAVQRDRAIALGNLMDMGVPQTMEYTMDINALVRHTLVAGSTGSGKSTTCKRILREVLNKDIPVMIVEPAKDDYVRWAMELNRTLPPQQQFTIYMPGVDAIGDMPLPQLKLNPFEPAAYGDSRVRILQHSEHFATLLNACLPSEDVIPILIDESVQHCIRVKTQNAGIDIDAYLNPQMQQYPTMVSLGCAGNAVIRRKTYAQQTKDSFEEILRTRFDYLKRGTRGSILNTPRSVNFDDLFSRPVVINLSCLAGSKDKALIMSMLLLALYEYRQSRYANDAAYRDAAHRNRLMHLMVIEEAHNVLTRPQPTSGGGSPETAVADMFTNILSEIRSYGQGMMIVDQVPTRLIEDAIKNTNYKIVHRLTAPDDIGVMAKGMGLNDKQTQMVSSLEIGHAIVCGDGDDGPSWVRMRRD